MGGTLILGFSLKGPVFNPCLCYTVLFAYVLLIVFTHVTVHVYIYAYQLSQSKGHLIYTIGICRSWNGTVQHMKMNSPNYIHHRL